MSDRSVDRTEYTLLFRIAAYAARKAGCTVEDAEDVAVTATARFYERPVGSIDRPEAWVNDVATNLAIDVYRKRNRERLEDGPVLDEFHAGGPSVDKQAVFRVMAAELERIAEQCLAPGELRAFNGLVAAGGSVADGINLVVDATGISPQGIRKQLTRAASKLRRDASHLAPQDREDGDHQ